MSTESTSSFMVPKECHRLRVDRFLHDRLRGVSRGDVLRLLLDGRVTIAGRRLAGPDYFVKKGELLTIEVALGAGTTPAAPTRLEVLYDDAHFVAIDKPAGLASLPTPDGDRSARSELESRLGVALFPVHRLDRVTSGVLLFARTAQAAAKISLAFQHHRIEKRYVAIVKGHVAAEAGDIDVALKSHPSARTGRIEASGAGREAFTHYRVIDHGGELTLVELIPKTGRRHQLRAHLAHIGHPILGDRLYGGGKADRVYLHASGIQLRSPGDGRTINLESPLPDEFRAHFPRA